MEQQIRHKKLCLTSNERDNNDRENIINRFQLENSEHLTQLSTSQATCLQYFENFEKDDEKAWEKKEMKRQFR